jgi:predicted transcriptional regulator
MSMVLDTLDALIVRGKTVSELAEYEGVKPQAIYRRLSRMRKAGKPIPRLNARIRQPRLYQSQNWD